MLIGGQDMVLPTTMVGNYPNPRWYDGHAFATLPKGEFIHDSISKEAFEDVVGAIVRDQEAAGLDVISDGKVYGGDSPYGTILYYYLERMSGYRLSGPPIGLPIYSTLFSPTCVGEISREVPFHLVNLRAVRKATKKPVKVSYTGLGVIAAATTNLHYKDTREVAMALAKAFNEDFKELADNGCDIIQLDEFVWPYGMGDWEIDALNAVGRGRELRVLGAHLLGQLLRHARLLPGRDQDRVRRVRAGQAGLRRPGPGTRPRDLPARARREHHRAELRGGPDRAGRSQAADRQQLDQTVRGRGHRREVHRHRERGRGRRPDQAGPGVRARRPAGAVHRLRADQPAPDDRRHASCARSPTAPPWSGTSSRASTLVRWPRPSDAPPGSPGPTKRPNLTLPGQRNSGPRVPMVRPHRSSGRRTVPECPTFLRLPARAAKPRSRGVTHVLDSGLTPEGTRAFLGQAGHLVDIVKVGWGIGYIDPALEERVGICADHDCPVSLGGTLLEVAALQDRVGELRDWALKVGMTHIEVSNGLRALPASRKHALVRELAADFVVLAETGAKEGNYPPTPAEWAQEMARDLDAGATWVIAEGRESGTVGLYHADQGIREDLVTAIVDWVPQDKVIFEAPDKSQQAWFVRQLGADVNLGNVAPASVLALETLRLGLRADTVSAACPGPRRPGLTGAFT